MPTDKSFGRAAAGKKPPVIILGGTANALSVARSLAPRGVAVYALNDAKSHVRFSRHATWIKLPEVDLQTTWAQWLLADGARRLPGAVLLPCSDDALELIAGYREQLEEHYLLPEADSDVLMRVLDKGHLHQIALEAGVPAPAVHNFSTREELEPVVGQFPYPCALKPRQSHLFQRHFPSDKMFVVHNDQELLERFAQIEPLRLDMILTEIIPGGEDCYCSYYTYLDENLEPLCHFTKRKVRQYPLGAGMGTYHLTDWNEEVAEMGLKFLQGAGLRGIGVPEFKRDPRDNTLKLIECNCRFSAAQQLVSASGLDLPLLMYNRLTGQPAEPVGEYRRGLASILWITDYLAFRGLNRRGELTLGAWLKSLLRPQVFPYFTWSDPLPTIIHMAWLVRDAARKRIRRIFHGGLKVET